MKLEEFQNLPARDKVQVCLAILLDDTESIAVLQLDAKKGGLYVEALEMFIRMQEDMRASLATTILRDSLIDL